MGTNVYRSDAGGPFEKISGDGPWRDTKFVDRDVKSGGRYCYVVRAVVGTKESADSNEVEVAVP